MQEAEPRATAPVHHDLRQPGDPSPANSRRGHALGLGLGLGLLVATALAQRWIRPPTSPSAEGWSYASPQACVWVYRVQVDESFAFEAYANQYNRREEHSLSWLAMGRDKQGELRALLVSKDAGVRSQSKAEATPQRIWRRLNPPRAASSGQGSSFGPAAPDVACRDRSWDSLEDALALGFPALPGALMPSSGTWSGAAVAGDGSTCSAANACCNLGACLNADDEHDPEVACVLPPWTERIDASEPASGEPARLISTWSDGRPGDRGASAKRVTIFDLARGRPLASRISLAHPFLGLRREIRIEAVDRCDGLTPAQAQPEAVERVRAEFAISQAPRPSP